MVIATMRMELEELKFAIRSERGQLARLIKATMRKELEELKFAIGSKRGMVCWFVQSYLEDGAGRTQIRHQEKKMYCKPV